jgi:hypothetical protein
MANEVENISLLKIKYNINRSARDTKKKNNENRRK